MDQVVILTLAGSLASAGILVVWKTGTWPGDWPVKGEPIILGLLAFVIYLGSAIAAGYVTGRIENDPGLVHLAVGSIRLICVAIFLWIVKTMVHDADPMHTMKPRDWRVVVFVLVPYVLILPLMFVFGPEEDTGQQAIKDLLDSKDVLPKASMFISLVIAAPLFEEFMFRGFLQGAMRRAYPAMISIPFVAFCFAFVHESAVRVPVFCLGLLLGVVYEKTRAIWAPWLLHTIHNLISFVFFVSGGVNAQ